MLNYVNKKNINMDTNFNFYPTKEELNEIKQCPVCNSANNKYFGKTNYHKFNLNYNFCINCSLIYMNPRPTQDWYNKLYKFEFWESKQKNPRGQLNYQLLKESTWAEKFIDYLKDTNIAKKTNPKILEIGCAYGIITKQLANFYKGEAWGVEPSDEASKFAKEVVGINIYARNMQEVIAISDENKFDLIIFSHCLENITNLHETLQAVQKLLRPDGILLIDTPNNLYRRSWHIHHPYCFTIKSISQLLSLNGFSIKKSFHNSRPKMLIGLQYLTILASKGKNNKKIDFKFLPIYMLIGRLSFKIINLLGKFGNINRKLGWTRWKPSKNSKILLKELEIKI